MLSSNTDVVNDYLENHHDFGIWSTDIMATRLYYLIKDDPNFSDAAKSRMLTHMHDQSIPETVWDAFGSENFAVMNMSTAYLKRQAFGLNTPEVKNWLIRYIREHARYGYAEYQSPHYFYTQFVGMLNLYDFARDEDLKYHGALDVRLANCRVCFDKPRPDEGRAFWKRVYISTGSIS